MDVEAWLQQFGNLVVDIQGRGSQPHAQRELLFGLWSLFMDAPQSVRRAFDRVGDEALNKTGADYGSMLLAEEPIAVPSADASLAAKVAFAACLLRGLEQAYLHAGAHTRSPRRAAEVATSYRGEEGYVIPFAPLFRATNKPWPSYFARRGLSVVRCIRKRLRTGHMVELEFSEPLASVDPVCCVAAIFENVTPLGADGEPIDFSKAGKFVFHGLASTPASIEQAMHDAMNTGEPADIIVFPELTMPPARVAEVVQLLRRKPWSQGGFPRAPALVVAGSWHYSLKGGYANYAPVLASNGTMIGRHAKHMPYTRDALVEDIEPSDRILVVATPNLAVAIGICLDFCQEADSENPYAELDVDLVLVPSMGSQTTIEAHERRGAMVWNLRKTATFVSQQSEKGIFGYVYSHSADGPSSEAINQQVSLRRLVTKG